MEAPDSATQPWPDSARGFPIAIAITRNGKTAYVVNDGSGTGNWHMPAVITPDGKTAYVISPSGVR